VRGYLRSMVLALRVFSGVLALQPDSLKSQNPRKIALNRWRAHPFSCPRKGPVNVLIVLLLPQTVPVAGTTD
jgi:hypothetical protein